MEDLSSNEDNILNINFENNNIHIDGMNDYASFLEENNNIINNIDKIDEIDDKDGALQYP